MFVAGIDGVVGFLTVVVVVISIVIIILGPSVLPLLRMLVRIGFAGVLGVFTAFREFLVTTTGGD